MVIAVGRIRRNEDLIGLRVFDTNTKQTKDIRIEDIDKVKIKNLKHLSELGIVDNKQEDKPIVVLGEKDEKYLTVDINGKARVLNSLKGYIYSDLLSNIDSYKSYIKNQKEKVFEFEIKEDTDEVLLKRYIPNNEEFRVIEIPDFITGIVIEDNGEMVGPFHRVTQSLKVINKNNKIKEMDYMFEGFSGKELDLSEFYTEEVFSMIGMFYDCKNIMKLDLSSFDTSKVVYMDSLFANSSLVRININSFNTSNVRNMDYMFMHCERLDALDLSSFNTISLGTMDCMFEGCRNLRALDLSNFNISKKTSIIDIFKGTSLTPENTGLK